MEEKLVLTAQGLVEYAKRCLTAPHVYVWDANGEYITHELLDRLTVQYPDWYTPERTEVRRSLAGRGIRGWDCIGLIKSYVWGDYHQGNTRYYTKESDFCTRTLIQEELVKGDISTMPEVPGLVLFRPGHVGIYIGNGRVIDCSLRDARTNEKTLLGGISETDIAVRGWTTWLQYPGIRY